MRLKISLTWVELARAPTLYSNTLKAAILLYAAAARGGNRQRQGDGLCRRERLGRATPGLGLDGGSQRGMPKAVLPTSMRVKVKSPRPYILGRLPLSFWLTIQCRRLGCTGSQLAGRSTPVVRVLRAGVRVLIRPSVPMYVSRAALPAAAALPTVGGAVNDCMLGGDSGLDRSREGRRVHGADRECWMVVRCWAGVDVPANDELRSIARRHYRVLPTLQEAVGPARYESKAQRN